MMELPQPKPAYCCGDRLRPCQKCGADVWESQGDDDCQQAMRSNNSKAMTAAERAHVERVKELPCSVCDLAGPSDGHHVKQGQHWTVVALCKECHQGAHNGWHGRKAMWAIKHMDDIDALAVTIRRLMS